MPAADALDAAIARLADECEIAEEVLQLAEAYDKLRHAGTGSVDTFALTGSDMLDNHGDTMGDAEERRVGFKRRPPLAY